jgi:ribonucleoside-diphosphate reductase alpha chain
MIFGEGEMETPPQGLALSDNALVVLRERYLRRGENGQLEEPAAMLRRVAKAVSEPSRAYGESPDFWAERFLDRMERLEFLPNSPTLMNAGQPGGQLAACFVLPIEDDLDSIFATLALVARIHQTGGGTGFSFSALRPRGDRVRSTGGVSSGPLSFMEVFDYTTSVIRAGGRRRGANMAVLRVDHPDIEEFIEAKRIPTRLQNFNLSVGVTDEFFAAFDSAKPFALRNPRTGQAVASVDPVKLFDMIVESAWATGDPGLLFLDEINRHNPTPHLGSIEATNPCGEQPLLPYESCTLGSLNLARFAAGNDVDWARLKEAVRDAVVFLDNVVDANCYPAAKVAEATRLTRKIGLGVMGLADLFAAIGVAYDSEQALALGGRIAEFLSSAGREASRELGLRRGSFPAFEKSVWHTAGYAAMRNATVTCVAPTGTISMIAGVSGGIEPFFALATVRNVLGGKRLLEVNAAVERELRALGEAGQAAMRALHERGSIRGVAGIPETLARRFPVALEIAPSMHVRMQAAFQRHIDAAVSKTVNLPHDASPDAVREVYLLARSLKLKGVTVYRYGSRTGQVLSLVEEQARPDCRECAV